MNNAQLDMVLGYLNEGTEIDSSDYMMESLNEMFENCIYESTMITSLLEEDDEIEDAEFRELNDDNTYKDGDKNEDLKDSKNKTNVIEKIKLAIRRFIKWVESLITKLKAQIAKLKIKALVPFIKKAVEKQKEKLKDADSNKVIKLGNIETCILFEEEMTNNKGILNVPTNVWNKYTMKKIKKYASEIPIFIIALSPSLGEEYNMRITVRHNKEITVGEYLQKIDKLSEKAQKCVNILDGILKEYNEAIREAKELYKEDSKAASDKIRSASDAMRDFTAIATGSVKATMLMLKLVNKNI